MIEIDINPNPLLRLRDQIDDYEARLNQLHEKFSQLTTDWNIEATITHENECYKITTNMDELLQRD